MSDDDDLDDISEQMDFRGNEGTRANAGAKRHRMGPPKRLPRWRAQLRAVKGKRSHCQQLEKPK